MLAHIPIRWYTVYADGRTGRQQKRKTGKNTMKTTIRAENGYTVKKILNLKTGEVKRILRDGDDIILIADIASFEQYKDDIENNEGFNFCECFETIKGTKYIHYCDTEDDIDYLVRLERR